MKGRGATVALCVAGLTACFAAAAWLLFRGLVYEQPAEPHASVAQPLEPPPGPAPAAAPSPERMEVAVLSTAGTVERSAGKGWAPLAAGERLGAEDAIRTGRASRAELAVGGRSRLSVADASQLTVREVTTAVHEFRLARGRLAVDYGEDGVRKLRIQDEAGRTVEARSARFSVLATGVTLAVATEAGRVTLRAAGGAVEVGAGEQSVARADTPPVEPRPISAAVLLKVAGAAAARGEDLCAAVSGTAAPGSQVEVDGVPVELSPDGRFEARVPRRPNQARVQIASRDVAGRVARRTVPCREADPELSGLSVRWRR